MNEKYNLINNFKDIFMESKAMRHWVGRSTFAAALALGATMMLQSCEDDTLTGQPSWLGNSIYERLQEEGNYTTTLKLIDDLGLTDVLRQTGSKTLFVADDAAYAEWFKDNSWGVSGYDDLSSAQKKLLLNSAMVNNAYLIELLSNVSGNPPETGKCMRRESALSIYDSVYIMRPDEMPETAVWEKHRNKKGIVLMKDNTSSPMIHFFPAFMEYNKFTDEDLYYLTGFRGTSIGEAWVNGRMVTERDITCKNGYIHKVDGVIEPTSNMAELIRQSNVKDIDGNPVNTHLWSKLLDRFSAPYYNKSISDEYNRLYGTSDSVFVLRYFSDWGAGGALTETPDGETAPNRLPFDPGWNHYMFSNTMDQDMHYDAGVMIVPTDEALTDWFESSPLKVQFGELDSVPDLTLKELLSVNMIESFVARGVTSKFENILDDAQLKLGIEKGDIVTAAMGCNGIVYVVNKVFTPSAYASVSFPALIREEILNVLYRSFDYLEFLPYLNSMDSKYSLFMPTNDALLWYLDPANYGETQQTMLEFYYDETKRDFPVSARRFYCTVAEDGTITKGVKVSNDVNADVVKNRLEDLIDQLIIVGDVEDGHTYYKSKGGTFLRVANAGTAGTMKVAGAWQMEHGTDIAVTEIYTEPENGRSYQLETQAPMSSQKSVYATLKAHPEYSLFLDLLFGGDPETPKQNMLITETGTSSKCTAGGAEGENYNMRLFQNYDYTVYVPTNEAIQKLIDDGLLPTWEHFEYYDSIYTDDNTSGYESDYAKEAREVIKTRIESFVRSHLQDNSVMIGGAVEKDSIGEPILNYDYETMKINEANGRFYPVRVNVSDGALTVVDYLGNTRNVLTTDGLYNNICREFWFEGTGNARKIFMVSDAVVHQIDGVLMNEPMTKWEEEVDENLK